MLKRSSCHYTFHKASWHDTRSKLCVWGSGYESAGEMHAGRRGRPRPTGRLLGIQRVLWQKEEMHEKTWRQLERERERVFMTFSTTRPPPRRPISMKITPSFTVLRSSARTHTHTNLNKIPHRLHDVYLNRYEKEFTFPDKCEATPTFYYIIMFICIKILFWKVKGIVQGFTNSLYQIRHFQKSGKRDW